MIERGLPENWIEIKIKELTDVISGGTPSTTKAEYFDGNIPWITPADLSKYNRKYIGQGRKNISQQGLKNSSARLLPKGTVLFSSRAPIGYVAIAENDLCTNQGFKNLLPNDLYDSSYAFYYLKSIKDLAESQASGTTFKELSGKKMGELPFLLPPLAEQKRIVAKLDEAFQHLDTLKAKMERIPELLKSFRQAVLTQAVTGKLTEEWREENKEVTSGEELFKIILKDIDLDYSLKVAAAKAEGKSKPKDKRNNKRSEKPSYDLPDLPDSWCYVRAEEISYQITDGAHFKPTYTDKGVKFLSVKNVRPFKVSYHDCKYIPEKEHEDLVRRCNPEPNDILYTKIGATYGYAARIKENYSFSIFVSLALIKPSKVLNSRFLELLFNSNIVFNQARQRISGSGVPDLHLIEIRDFKLPLMSSEEQNVIVEKVETLFARANAIETAYSLLKNKIDKLPNAILAKAFRGELVPQDSNDEPASGLLEKIKASKLSAIKPEKEKKTKKKNQAELTFL